eukprot:7387492-Prymnesium_polylepis.1
MVRERLVGPRDRLVRIEQRPHVVARQLAAGVGARVALIVELGRRVVRRLVGRVVRVLLVLERALALAEGDRRVDDVLRDARGERTLEQTRVERVGSRGGREGRLGDGPGHKGRRRADWHFVAMPRVNLHWHNLDLLRRVDQLRVARRVAVEALPVLATVGAAHAERARQATGGAFDDLLDDVARVRPTARAVAGRRRVRRGRLAEARVRADERRLEVVVVGDRDGHGDFALRCLADLRHRDVALRRPKHVPEDLRVVRGNVGAEDLKVLDWAVVASRKAAGEGGGGGSAGGLADDVGAVHVGRGRRRGDDGMKRHHLNEKTSRRRDVPFHGRWPMMSPEAVSGGRWP